MKVLQIVSAVVICSLGLAALEIKLPQEKAVQGQEYTIVVKAEGKDISFAPVETIGGHEVVEKNEVINTIFINKDIIYQKRLILTIVAQNSFTIEPLTATVDDVVKQTQEVFVEVEKPKDLTKGKYFIKLFTDKDLVYKNEPLEVTMQLYELKQKRLLELLYSPPSKENFFVKQKGQERSYEKDQFIIHEINYLYYPQKAGKLTIEGANARIGVPVKAEDMFGQTYVPKQQMIYSKNLSVEVVDLNQSVDLVGEAALTQTLSKTEVEANEPLFIDLQLKGSANFYDFKGFELLLEGVTVYEGVTKITPQSYKQSFSIVANKDFKIPTQQIKLFDTKKEEVVTLQTDAVSVAVNNQTPQQEPVVEVVEKKVIDIKFLLLSFISGAFAAIGGWYLIRKIGFKQKPKEQNIQKLLKRCDDGAVFERVKKLYLLQKQNKLGKEEQREYKKLLRQLQKKF